MRASASTAGLILLALGLFTVTAVRAEPTARLSVAEGDGVARAAWPITLGMPLPKKWLKAGETVHLKGSAGDVSTQQRALAHWPDGSVRWLLLDFQSNLGARQRSDLQLLKGAGPSPKTKVSVQQRGGDVEIDTGAIRVLAGKGSGGFFRLLAVNGAAVKVDPVRGEMVSGGQAWPAEPIAQPIIEERGPLRAAVALRGQYANGFEYDIRLEAYAGQPWVRVLHTFANTTTPMTTAVERLTIHLPAPVTSTSQYVAGLDSGQTLHGDVGEKGESLAQIDAGTLRVGAQSRPGRLAGRFELRGAPLELALEAPFFWQEFPQAVRISQLGIAYDLWADVGAAAMIGVGAAKTHELFAVYGGGGEPLARPGRGVTATPDPAWTAASGAMLNAVDPTREAAFVAAADSAFTRYMQSVDTEAWDEAGACAPGKQEIRRQGFYGMLNWGDWNFRGYHDTTKDCDAWGNQEYDQTQVLALLFAATGRPEVRRFLTASARHYGEVDRIHHQPQHPEWVGMNHPKNPQHFSFEFGGVDLGHTWVEGMFTYYFLTGEPRALAAGVGIADYLVRRVRNTLKGNPRQFGWPALALAAAYDATGEARYRDAALDYARLGIRAHPMPGKVGKDWKLAILAEAVSYVHAITGDTELRTWLGGYAAAVIARQPKDVRYYAGVAYVARIEKQAGSQDTARNIAARIVFGDWGKPFTIGGRAGFRILATLDS